MFAKDILLIDIEATDLDIEGNGEPVQLGAILLDKETLKEKLFILAAPSFSENWVIMLRRFSNTKNFQRKGKRLFSLARKINYSGFWPLPILHELKPKK